MRSTAGRDQPGAVVREATSAATCTALPPLSRISLGGLAAGYRIAPDVGQQHVEPVGGQPDRDRPADAGGRPGDDGAAHAHIPHLPVPILPGCPASHSSLTACSTRTPRPTAARAAPASTRRWSTSCAERGWRIEQMPCPELAFTGLNRFWAVREQYDTTAFRRHCRRLAAAVAGAIEVHVRPRRGRDPGRHRGQPLDGRAHHQLRPGPRRPAGVAGRRPGALARQGIFLEELRAELAERGVTAPRAMGDVAPAAHARSGRRAGAAGRADGGGG